MITENAKQHNRRWRRRTCGRRWCRRRRAPATRSLRLRWVAASLATTCVPFFLSRTPPLPSQTPTTSKKTQNHRKKLNYNYSGEHRAAGARHAHLAALLPARGAGAAAGLAQQTAGACFVFSYSFRVEGGRKEGPGQLQDLHSKLRVHRLSWS